MLRMPMSRNDQNSQYSNRPTSTRIWANVCEKNATTKSIISAHPGPPHPERTGLTRNSKTVRPIARKPPVRKRDGERDEREPKHDHRHDPQVPALDELDAVLGRLRQRAHERVLAADVLRVREQVPQALVAV